MGERQGYAEEGLSLPGRICCLLDKASDLEGLRQEMGKQGISSEILARADGSPYFLMIADSEQGRPWLISLWPSPDQVFMGTKKIKPPKFLLLLL